MILQLRLLVCWIFSQFSPSLRNETISLAAMGLKPFNEVEIAWVSLSRPKTTQGRLESSFVLELEIKGQKLFTSRRVERVTNVSTVWLANFSIRRHVTSSLKLISEKSNAKFINCSSSLIITLPQTSKCLMLVWLFVFTIRNLLIYVLNKRSHRVGVLRLWLWLQKPKRWLTEALILAFIWLHCTLPWGDVNFGYL